jgi:hypothetical protein
VPGPEPEADQRDDQDQQAQRPQRADRVRRELPEAEHLQHPAGTHPQTGRDRRPLDDPLGGVPQRRYPAQAVARGRPQQAVGRDGGAARHQPGAQDRPPAPVPGQQQGHERQHRQRGHLDRDGQPDHRAGAERPDQGRLPPHRERQRRDQQAGEQRVVVHPGQAVDQRDRTEQGQPGAAYRIGAQGQRQPVPGPGEQHQAAERDQPVDRDRADQAVGGRAQPGQGQPERPVRARCAAPGPLHLVQPGTRQRIRPVGVRVDPAHHEAALAGVRVGVPALQREARQQRKGPERTGHQEPPQRYAVEPAPEHQPGPDQQAGAGEPQRDVDRPAGYGHRGQGEQQRAEQPAIAQDRPGHRGSEYVLHSRRNATPEVSSG